MDGKKQKIFEHYQKKMLRELEDVVGDEIETEVGIGWDLFAELMSEYLYNAVEDRGMPYPPYPHIFASVMQDFGFYNPELAKKLKPLVKEYEIHLEHESEIESGVELAQEIYPPVELEIPPRFSKK